MANGIYFVSVKVDNRLLIVKKIIKEN
jgi:hypothetical protein